MRLCRVRVSDEIEISQHKNDKNGKTSLASGNIRHAFYSYAFEFVDFKLLLSDDRHERDQLGGKDQ
jgi:hypothetical protein